MGNCLAGEGCPFSHDPAALVGSLELSDGSSQIFNPTQPFQLENNYETFPALQPTAGPGEQWSNPYLRKYPNHILFGNQTVSQPSGGGRRNGGVNQSRPHSRPTSRHQQRDLNPSPLSVDDPEAFPTLSAVSSKGSGKKHHGKRGGHNRESNLNKESTPSSLADIVRMSPSPAPGKSRSSAKLNKDGIKSRELSAAAQAIPAPKHIPWLETGTRANQQYIKYRTDAIRHGTVRNKFLQRYQMNRERSLSNGPSGMANENSILVRLKHGIATTPEPRRRSLSVGRPRMRPCENAIVKLLVICTRSATNTSPAMAWTKPRRNYTLIYTVSTPKKRLSTWRRFY